MSRGTAINQLKRQYSNNYTYEPYCNYQYSLTGGYAGVRPDSTVLPMVCDNCGSREHQIERTKPGKSSWPWGLNSQPCLPVKLPIHLYFENFTNVFSYLLYTKALTSHSGQLGHM